MEEAEVKSWRRRRLLKTICLVAAWVSAGMYTSMVGPALIDLTEVARCNYQQLAYALTAKNVALTLAALASGFFCSRYQRHLEAILSVCLVVLGLSTAAVPWCSLLPVMGTAMMFQGLTHGILGVAGNSWVALLWEGSSSGPLHALHFGNSLGGVLAPLIIRPFLSTDTNHTIGATPAPSANHTGPETPTRIQIPFGAYGAYTVVWGAVFLYFYITDRRQPARRGLYHMERTKPTSQVRSDSSTFAGVKRSFGLSMAVLLFLLYVAICGLYQAIPTYLMPLSVDGDLHLTKSEGNLLIFGYSLLLVAGRLVGTVLSKCLSIHVMFCGEIVLTLGIAIVLTLYAFRSVVILWVLVCSFGFISSPIFPSGIAWSEAYLEIAGPLMAVFFAGGGLGTLILQYLGGYGIQNIGIYFPIYANLGCAILTSVFYSIAAISCYVYSRHTASVMRERQVKDEPDETQPLIN